MDIAFLETTQGRLPGQAVMHQDINAVSHVEQVAAETGDDFPVAIVGFQNKDGATGHWMPAPCAHASAGIPVIVGQKIAQESAPFFTQVPKRNTHGQQSEHDCLRMCHWFHGEKLQEI